MRPPWAPVLISGLALLAVACAPAPRTPSAEDVARAASAMPADARLAALYTRSCRACHGQPGTGAPLARDRAEWDARWAKGLTALTTSAVSGYRGMPAGGQCFACTPDDFRALITFMAARASSPGG
jgi:cytochrome c5